MSRRYTFDLTEEEERIWIVIRSSMGAKTHAETMRRLLRDLHLLRETGRRPSWLP